MPARSAVTMCDAMLTFGPADPALSMPAGWADVEDGGGRLPVGMQLVARRWDERSIFRAAAAWERGGLGLDRWDGRVPN